uniref:Peptidase S1 domain-containing protein n=1 Tax=Gopherus evgoodei TaxID=1825980 RepID=A0A8C4WLK3_9SAUR
FFPGFTRVIGGQEAPLGSRPYMAYVQIGSTGSCGGFLIREDVVVTAAHCNCNLGNIFVYLGVQDFTKPGQNWQRIRARRWIQHPDFNNENYDNDIMLAELTEWVGLVSLPEADQHIGPGSECSVAGWGRTGVNTTTDTLQEAEQEVVSDSLCREQYQHYNPTTMLCAGSPLTNQSAFQVNISLPRATGGTTSCSRGRSQWKPPWLCPSHAPLPQDGSPLCIMGDGSMRLEMRGRFLTIRGRRFWNNIQQEHCWGDSLTRIQTELDKFMDGII